MKRVKLLMLVLLSFVVVPFALNAADIQMHGDFNNRFMLGSNHDEWFNGGGGGPLDKSSVTNFWGDAKVRLWTDYSTNEGKVKGVWAAEFGGIEYGKNADKVTGVNGKSISSVGKSTGGGFSGDGINIETRWLYTDFKLPWNDKLGIKMGLFPLKINKYYWAETQMGIQLYGNLGNVSFITGWTRGDEYRSQTHNDDTGSLDSFYGKVDFKPVDNFKMNVWLDYTVKNRDSAAGNVAVAAGLGEWYEIKHVKHADLSILALGASGNLKFDDIFANFDFIYENGNVDKVNFTGYSGAANTHNNFDLSAWFAHIDLGYNFGNAKLTYTFWYASGDDNDKDGDFDGFMSVDVDISNSVTLMEGVFTDDDYFVETPYIGDKGFIMNQLKLDYKANPKLTVGTSVMYMMLAEDLKYTYVKNGVTYMAKSDTLGLELNAYLKYKLYKNLEFAINAAYLAADDALDYWEVQKDGNSDEDIFVSTARVRYKF